MARKNDSPQKAAMREMMRDYLKNNEISTKNGTDVNSIMRGMMSALLEGALDEGLNGELGYSKYDYQNKDTDNSRNGHPKKAMYTSYGDMDISIPRDCNEEYEPQLVKKYQNTVTQGMEETPSHVFKRHGHRRYRTPHEGALWHGHLWKHGPAGSWTEYPRLSGNGRNAR